MSNNIYYQAGQLAALDQFKIAGVLGGVVGGVGGAVLGTAAGGALAYAASKYLRGATPAFRSVEGPAILSPFAWKNVNKKALQSVKSRVGDTAMGAVGGGFLGTELGAMEGYDDNGNK